MNRREYIQQTSRYLGYTLLSGAVIDLLASCEQHGNQQWDPIFFSKEEAATLSAITDTICPTTKTPGANELGVPKFIDTLIHDLLKKESQDFYKKGIEEVNADANRQFGKRFEQCDTKQKESILIALDKASAPTALTMWGKPMEANPTPLSFYRKIKDEGYWLDWNGQHLPDLKPINDWVEDYCNPEIIFEFPRWFNRFTNQIDFLNRLIIQLIFSTFQD